MAPPTSSWPNAPAHGERAGLRFPPLSATLRATVSDHIPAFGSAANPVDLTAQVLADASRVSRVCAAVADSDEVDAVVFIATMVTGEEARSLAADLAATIARAGKPILTVWLAADLNTEDVRRIFGRAGLPVFRRIPEAVGVLRRLRDAAPEPRAAAAAPASSHASNAVSDASAAVSNAASWPEISAL